MKVLLLTLTAALALIAAGTASGGTASCQPYAITKACVYCDPITKTCAPYNAITKSFTPYVVRGYKRW